MRDYTTYQDNPNKLSIGASTPLGATALFIKEKADNMEGKYRKHYLFPNNKST